MWKPTGKIPYQIVAQQLIHISKGWWLTTMRVDYEKGAPNVSFSITYLHTSSTYASKMRCV